MRANAVFYLQHSKKFRTVIIAVYMYLGVPYCQEFNTGLYYKRMLIFTGAAEAEHWGSDGRDVVVYLSQKHGVPQAKPSLTPFHVLDTLVASWHCNVFFPGHCHHFFHLMGKDTKLSVVSFHFSVIGPLVNVYTKFSS